MSVTHSYGIYQRFDKIKLAYVCYQYAHGTFRLDCAFCPDDIASVFDKSKRSHRSKIIHIARHRGSRGDFIWFNIIKKIEMVLKDKDKHPESLRAKSKSNDNNPYF